MNTARIRRLPVLGLALALGAALAFLYVQTRENASGYFQNLALAHQLQQLDASWERDVIRSKMGLNANYDALVEPLNRLGHLQQQLDDSARKESPQAAAMLLEANAAFGREIQNKTQLVETFKSHNSILHNSLAFLPTAAADLQKAVRSGPYARQVRELLLDILVYNETPSRSQAAAIEAGLTRLSRERLSASSEVRPRLEIFSGHVRTMLRERMRVNRLLSSIAAVPTGARIQALERVLGDIHLASERHTRQSRQLLLVFSTLLVGLLIALTVKLVRSHAQVHRMNQELERRVRERTGALEASNRDLRAHQAQLSVQARELEKARDVAEAANDAKSAFLATMSHELRTPLNAIIGFSELIRGQPFGPLGNPKYVEYATDVNKSGAHLLALINDILDLSRLDAGKVELVEEPFCVAHLVTDVCRSLAPLAHESNLTVTTELPPDLPDLWADQRRVRQIVLNLVSNAVKFTPAGGAVTVRAEHRPQGLMLQVSDTGIGMSAVELPKAMERFGQVDSRLARKYEGTGLGLPLVKQLVEIHGGQFDIQSEPGIGTVVTIGFPDCRIADLPAAVPLPPQKHIPQAERLRA
jgi:signal transduction histidine kinase